MKLHELTSNTSPTPEQQRIKSLQMNVQQSREKLQTERERQRKQREGERERKIRAGTSAIGNATNAAS